MTKDDRAAAPRSVAVVGHTAEGSAGADGQILRTRIVIEELRLRLGPEHVQVIDTGGGRRGMVRALWGLLHARRTCSDVIVMPGSRGLRRLLPLYARWSRRTGIRTHYLVVGGWLPRYVRDRPGYLPDLRALDGLYVQTRRMQHDLRAMGLDNVHLLPNFRRFPRDRPRSGACQEPLRLVFLSRVMQEKGAGLAVDAVEAVNHEAGSTVATLDLYGPVESHARAWFDARMDAAGTGIRYQGALAPERVQEHLIDYDVMLFPTYYGGEAFPGVILDAMIAGIPVIASDWQDNAEVVEHGRTGWLCTARDVDALARAVRWSVEHPEEVMRMKHEAAAGADAFHVDEVLPPLLRQLGLASQAEAGEVVS